MLYVGGHGAPEKLPTVFTQWNAPGLLAYSNLLLEFNPLKPSVIERLHYESSSPQGPNLPFSTSDIQAL